MTDLSKDTVLFHKELSRMCKGYASCNDCPLQLLGLQCFWYSKLLDDKLIYMINKVQEWSNAHPLRTYAEDFFEKFPKAEKLYKTSYKNGGVAVPGICIKRIYGSSVSKCGGISCTECWSRPIEE